jgi:hypothetical protein
LNDWSTDIALIWQGNVRGLFGSEQTFAIRANKLGTHCMDVIEDHMDGNSPTHTQKSGHQGE